MPSQYRQKAVKRKRSYMATLTEPAYYRGQTVHPSPNPIVGRFILPLIFFLDLHSDRK